MARKITGGPVQGPGGSLPRGGGMQAQFGRVSAPQPLSMGQKRAGGANGPVTMPGDAKRGAILKKQR